MEKNIQAWIDESKLLRKLSIIVGIGSVIFSGLVFFTGIQNKLIAFDSYGLLIIPFIVIAVLAFNSSILGYFEEKTGEEEEERAEIEKRREKMMLNVEEDALFQWHRSLRLYNKYSSYAVILINMLLIGGLLYLFWNYWGRRLKVPELGNSLQCAFSVGLISAISLFSGIFCVGQSRDKAFRSMRPIGAWFIFSFLMGIFAAVAMILQKFGYAEWDLYMRRASFLAIFILLCELLVNFIIEFYRPRTAFEDRPVFESRILSLLTEPGGVVRNISDTLDYQFGFRITRQEIYAFTENAIVPLLIIWLIALWLFTCVVEVKTNEMGIREFFGKRQECPPLNAGIYLKAPWPFAKISRFPVYEIQELLVGPEIIDEKGQETNPEVILWTKKHYAKEPRFLVASEKEVSGDDAPVSFLAAAFPIQFQIKQDEIINYAYLHRDTPKILKTVAEEEITKYLSSVDIIRSMSVDRQKMINDLGGIIQKAVDDLHLGVHIVSVNFLDSHPPTDEVAPSFQEVVGALEEKETKILSAKKYENMVLPAADSQAYEIILNAKTYSESAEKLAKGEKERFMKQLDAFRIMPEMFKLRYYLDFFENDCRDIRKVVIGSTIPHNVFILNLEEKARLDLIDTDLVEMSDSKKSTGR